MTISGDTSQADEPLILAAELPRSPHSPSAARRLTRSALGLWRVRPDVLDTAELLISELVSNAVKCSQAGPEEKAGTIALTLRLHRAELTAWVSDPETGPPIVREARADAENGRGMLLVQALSKERGYYPRPPDGKVVYFVLAAGQAHGTSAGALAA